MSEVSFKAESGSVTIQHSLAFFLEKLLFFLCSLLERLVMLCCIRLGFGDLFMERWLVAFSDCVNAAV